MDQSRSLSGVSSNASTLAGLLALFNGGPSTGGNDLFSALLSGMEATPNISKDTGSQAVNATTATASPCACPGADNTGTNTLRALSDLSQTMHKIISMLRRNSNGSSNNASDQGGRSQATATTDSTSTTTTDAATLSSNDVDTVTITDADNTDSAQIASAPDLTDVNLHDPQTLEDVLAELVVLIQFIQQQLQEMQAAQASGVAIVGSADSMPTTPLLDALERLFGAQESDDGTPADAASTEDILVPRGLLETLFRRTDDVAEKLLDALVDRAAKIAVGETNGETDAPDELAKLVDLGAEIRQTLSAVRRVKTPEDAIFKEETGDASTAPRTTTDPTALAAPTAANTTAIPDEATLNATVVASAVTQKFAATPAASSAKAAETIAPRVMRSETQSRAATTAATASTTATVANATGSPATTTATPSVSASTNTNAEFDGFLSNNETFTRGSNDNFRSFGSASEGVGAMGSYSFTSTLSALRAANGGATGLPSAVDQVILHMNRCVKNGDTHISLQLQPGDLGKITVKLDVASDGNVQGTVLADNPKTLEMLQKDSRSLERALQDAGLRAEPGSLSFSLNGQNNPNAGQSENANTSGANGTFSAQESGGDGVAETAALAETYYIRPSGVNIRV